MPVLKHVAVWHDGMMTIVPDAVEIQTASGRHLSTVMIQRLEGRDDATFHKVTQVTSYYGVKQCDLHSKAASIV